MGRGPLDLILVRHGESEGNLAQARSKKGDESDWEGEFGGRHTCRYRLTDRGRRQGAAAGTWIKENIAGSFDAYFTSEYVRAMETAATMDFPDASWRVEFHLRERDKGVLGGLSKKERKEQYAEELERRDRDIFYWQPLGGESIANMCLRVDRFLNSIWDECTGLRVLVVCHGNIIEGFRLVLERMTQHHYIEQSNSNDPKDRLHNCQVLWYSRRNPHTNKVESNLNWLRSTVPWDPSLSTNVWTKIARPTFNSGQLLDRVKDVPQLVNNEAAAELKDAEAPDTNLLEVANNKH